jgi:hypothetical protein
VKDAGFTAGISDKELNPAISIYPNPTKDFVTIEMENASDSYELTLLDNKGRFILSQSFTHSATLNLEKQASGTYILQVLSKTTGDKFSKLIKR